MRDRFRKQDVRDDTAIVVHEVWARFHIVAEHHLCDEPTELHQNMELLSKVLECPHSYMNVTVYTWMKFYRLHAISPPIVC